MAVYGLLAKAAGTVVTGLVGVTAYEVVRKAVAKAPLHETAVKGAELACAAPARPRRPPSRRGSSWPT